MLGFSMNTQEDALAILKSDHDKVKGLFEQFEKTENRREKQKIIEQAIMELKIHAAIEEEIFYPAVRREIEDTDLMNEANEEHHVAKLLIAELDQMRGSEEHYDAKFTVLSENIRHHVKEEEGEMFPKVRSLGLDLEALGQKMLVRKQQLKKTGVPKSDEERLMARGGFKADSPAKAVKNHMVKNMKRSQSAKKKTAAKKSSTSTKRKPAPKRKRA